MEFDTIGKHQVDYYSINNDWLGDRVLKDTYEAVQFHNNSSVRIWCNEQSEGFDHHWHTALEIIMPAENYYDVEMGQNHYHLQPGDIFIITSGEMHRLIAPESGRRFIFLFDIAMFANLKGYSTIQTLLSQTPHITKESHPRIYEDVYQIMTQIRNDYFGMADYAEITICSLLLNLFSKIGYNHLYQKELFPNIRLSKQKEHVKKFNDLLDYINVHYTEELSLENMANHIGFSKFHFSRLFKQYTNLTFNEYLNYRRLKAAEELLADRSVPITEVSMRSGFSSISSFNRLFKEAKHCSPREYRSMNTKEF